MAAADTVTLAGDAGRYLRFWSASAEVTVDVRFLILSFRWFKERKSYENSSTNWLAGLCVRAVRCVICRGTMARARCR